MISMYDLEDNLITIFETYKECAKYFNTTTNVIYCHISRSTTGTLDKKRDKKNNRWVRLYKIEDTDEE